MARKGKGMAEHGRTTWGGHEKNKKMGSRRKEGKVRAGGMGEKERIKGKKGCKD